jgi:ribosomal protein S18 acetylase RimI-like enzyme
VGFVIRDAVPRDADAIAAVHQASRDAAYRGRIDEALLKKMGAGERRRRWVAWLTDPSVVTLVVEEDGEVVAFSTLRGSRDEDADGRGVAEMPTLYVRPDRMRRGLGSLLCRATCERATALGYRDLTLWVLELNEAARCFYDAFGFLDDGVTKLDDGPIPAPLTARRYRLALEPPADRAEDRPAS